MKESHGYDTKDGAGIILLCPATRRILLGLRSADSGEPHTWCNFGGGIQTGESPYQGAYRENIEETEIIPHKVIRDPHIDVKEDGSKYHNFIGIVKTEITPTINEEHDDYDWVTLPEIAELNLNPHFKRSFMNMLGDVKSYLFGRQ